ncbi:helix-turn-helix domain-containing protein [Saccharothrix sp. NRRL B-16348]|uniref:helix-turn-helix domain-containing protein n=1 Tax=Saccharothrix sp. NRRL B-16348 TaxID=1415542 RepID=UPI0009E7534E|nr:helix-turn-helix domain-containing protein [Saccharothrix sp. NRRL B-16348]
MSEKEGMQVSLGDDSRDEGPLRPDRASRDQQIEPQASVSLADQGTTADGGSRPSVLERAFQILELVANEDRPMNLTEMSRAVKLPLPTTHRLAKSLVKLRALERNHGRFTLGPVWSEWPDATLEQGPARRVE